MLEKVPALILSIPTIILLSVGKEMIANATRAMASEIQRVDDTCASREDQLERLHRAQRSTLELELSWQPVPSMKYSKRVIELQKSKTA